MVRPGRDRLSGLVEVDETYIGGEKKGKRGRGAEGKALVVIAVEDKAEEGIGRIRMAVWLMPPWTVSPHSFKRLSYPATSCELTVGMAMVDWIPLGTLIR